MYYCEDCEQTFDDLEQIWLQDKNGEITDYANVCPLCGSVNVKEKEDNVRD